MKNCNVITTLIEFGLKPYKDLEGRKRTIPFTSKLWEA